MVGFEKRRERRPHVLVENRADFLRGGGGGGGGGDDDVCSIVRVVGCVVVMIVGVGGGVGGGSGCGCSDRRSRRGDQAEGATSQLGSERIPRCQGPAAA